MLRTVVAGLTLALAIASAKTYTVKVFQPAVFAGTVLKAGEYKIEVNGDKVSLKAGEKVLEASASVQNTDSKNPATILRYASENGRMHIREILLEGTNTRIVQN